MASNDTACADLRKLVETHEPLWKPYQQAMRREHAFLEGDRYEPDYGPENTDARLTQIRGMELPATIREFCAEVTARPRSVQSRPIGRSDEPDLGRNDAVLGEAMTSLITNELKDPNKGFDELYYETVYDSLARRHGILWMDWEPGFGEYGGEIFFSTLDPEQTMWDPPYKPHHPLCGWFFYKKRMPVEWWHANYPKTKSWLKSDYACQQDSARQGIRAGVPLSYNAPADTAPLAHDDGKAEGWFCWYKNDPSETKRETGGRVPVPDEQRYLSCTNGCGYRSPMQGELQQQGKIESELPDVLEQSCPTCGGDLERVDAFAEEESIRAYPKGRRLQIQAGLQQSPNDEPIYNGKWPIPRARSFPGLFLFAELDPRKPTGKCPAYWMWDQQKASDTLRTVALQRVLEHRTYWVMDAIGYEDYNGDRYEFRNDQPNQILLNRAKLQDWGNPELRAVNASGLDPNWSIAFNAVQQALTQYRPVVDYGLTEDSSKNIAVGTVQQLTKQGKITIEEYKRRASLALSQFYGVVEDYIRATYTPQRINRLDIEGGEVLAGIWGEDMPQHDYVVEETPDFTGLEKEKAEAVNALLQVIPMAAQLGLPAGELVDIYSEAVNLPRSISRRVQRMLEAAQAQAEAQAQAAQAAAMGGALPGGEDAAMMDQLGAGVAQ